MFWNSNFGRIPWARKRPLQSITYRKATVFGRIFGASRQKPGFPLQSFCLRQKGFPLQSLARAQRQHKIEYSILPCTHRIT
jgi:hypothetical protein